MRNFLTSASALAVAAAALLGPAPAAGHDFWVQPAAYWTQSHAVIPVTLQVGHGASRQRSPIPLQRVVKFQVVGPNGDVTDQRRGLTLGAPLKDGDIVLAASPGAYLVVLQTDDRAQTHLPALRFNDYLKAEGLTPALERRARLRRMDMDESESYSRCAKSILQVGASGADARGQAQVTRPLGLPLEIVPERSPYAEPRAASFPVRVLYRGRPLPGALVKLTRLEDDANPVEIHRTDRAGRAGFAMPRGGSWLLNVIWTAPQPPSAETDYATVFSSLSFAAPAARP